MKKILIALSAFALMGLLAGCGSALSLDVTDMGGATITAKKSASGEATTQLSIEEESLVTIASGLEAGTVTVTLDDGSGSTVIEAEMTPQSMLPIQTQVTPGEYTLTATAENATGEVAVTVDKTGWGAGMANPWTEAASAEQAAQNAGIDSFTLPDSIDLAGQTFSNASFISMSGMAEATLDGPTAQLVIRKGGQSEEPDISGDYNEYAAEWTQMVDGLRVTCYGAQEDAAAKLIWSSDIYAFSAVYYPLDPDGSGLSTDDVNALVSAVS